MICKIKTCTIKLTVYLSAALSTVAAYSQVSSAVGRIDAASTTSSPVAWIYVANTPEKGSPNEIVAYSAMPNGALAEIPGSPFAENVGSMAVNGKYLMGAS